MKTSLPAFLTASVLVISPVNALGGDPRIDSWLTDFSGRYARIYANAAAQASGTAVTTWSNGSQTQSLPAYAGVQEIYSSTDWVYLRTTGLGGHTMGPWPNNFPNLPANQHVFYRVPRNPVVPAAKTLTGLGSIGYFVDGVAMFDSRDGFVWNGTTEGNGQGYWNREAYVNEGRTFDPAYAHQENSGTYHYHADPIALRFLLGDHVDYHADTKTYVESAGPVTRHSPILGWVRDGFPVYGPYGYATANDSQSGLRRMVSGYQLRNGEQGTDNLTTAGRATLPAWAVRLYNVSAQQAGPAVNTTYPLGRYMEDNAYLGDLGRKQGVDFDLDEYNGRFCVTPEFPGGTYAYFVALTPSHKPAFPYNIGRAFHGTPSGSAVTTLNESVTTNHVAGPSAPTTLATPARPSDSGTVTLVWSSVEGGTYRLESSPALPAWSADGLDIPSQGTSTQFITDGTGSTKFFRVTRTALASHDSVTNATTGGGGGGGGAAGSIVSVSPTSAERGTTFTLTLDLNPAAQPPPPPQNIPVNSVTIGAIAGSGNVHVSRFRVTSSFTVPANAPTGPQTVTVVFPGPPGSGMTMAFALVNGFNIQ